MCWVVMRLTANDTESETAAKIERIFQGRDVALPLPGGEGRGEGERERYFQPKCKGTGGKKIRIIRHGLILRFLCLVAAK